MTNLLIEKGIAWEANPWLMDIAGKPGFITLKIVGVLLAAFMLWDVHRRYPQAAFWVATFFLAVYAGILVWNLRLLILG